MVKFKGKKIFRQFLPSKPIRFGFKLLTIAESCTGYIYDFEVYTGRRGEAELNQTWNVVLWLLGPLEGEGYWLFTDNFFTSPELYFSLREHGIQACRTVRPSRKDLPKKKSWTTSSTLWKTCNVESALSGRRKNLWILLGKTRSQYTLFLAVLWASNCTMHQWVVLTKMIKGFLLTKNISKLVLGI